MRPGPRRRGTPDVRGYCSEGGAGVTQSALLLGLLVRVIVGPGWSQPVITIEVPGSDQFKALVVTEGNHIHQMWDYYEDIMRIGYNVVLPDGTVLMPDTLFSRDVWSSYPSATHAPDGGIIGFWRESSPKWYSVKDADGNTVVPATQYGSEGWSYWPTIDASMDSLGRIHMVWDSGPLVCYSILEPGVGEVQRTTIPDSKAQALVLVDGGRVHIKYNRDPGIGLANYIQYDLDGNVTVPPVVVVEASLDDSNTSSMAVDQEGNVYILVFQSSYSNGRRLYLYKIDPVTGEKLIDALLIYQIPSGKDAQCVQILPTASGDAFYLLWIERDTWSPHPRWIRFAVIDTNGEFLVEIHNAYDYTDEEVQNIQYMEADTNADGDIFIIYSEGDPDIPGYWVVLGWFDHTELSLEESAAPVLPAGSFSLVPSENPFGDHVMISAGGPELPAYLKVYDASGRQVNTLLPSSDGVFLWNGSSPDGNELPSGVYLLKAEGYESLRLVRR